MGTNQEEAAAKGKRVYAGRLVGAHLPLDELPALERARQLEGSSVAEYIRSLLRADFEKKGLAVAEIAHQ